MSAIAGGMYHTVALKDGAVLAWGLNNRGQCTTPLRAMSGVTGISGGVEFTVVLAPSDCDGDGISDIAAIAAGVADVDANGIPDACEVDCNENQVPDGYELAIGTAADHNANGTLDVCDIAADPTLDLDQDGILDSYQIAQNPPLDSNQNGILDRVELAVANAQVADLSTQNAALVSQVQTLAAQSDQLLAQNADLQLQLTGLSISYDSLAAIYNDLATQSAAQAVRLNCGDLDGDGEVGGADIGLVLLNFGPCTQ